MTGRKFDTDDEGNRIVYPSDVNAGHIAFEDLNEDEATAVVAKEYELNAIVSLGAAVVGDYNTVEEIHDNPDVDKDLLAASLISVVVAITGDPSGLVQALAAYAEHLDPVLLDSVKAEVILTNGEVVDTIEEATKS